MTAYARIFLILTLTLLLTAACAGQLKKPARRIDFYTLEYPSPQPAGKAPLPVVLGVQRFRVAPTYNTQKIVYRDRNFKRNTYQYHKWRAEPGDLVGYFLARDLTQAAVFRAVFSLEKNLPTSHIIEGTVDEFFESDTSRSWEAVLTVSITLMKTMEPDISKRIISQKTYRARKPCGQKNPRALAAAMSLAMAEISEAVMNDVYASLADEK